MNRAAPIFALILGGCSVTGTTELPAPRSGGIAEANVASVPTVASELFGFGDETLMSRASLVQMNDEATCFDLLIRRPILMEKDRQDLALKVSVEVDGVDSSSYQDGLVRCTAQTSCLPADSTLQSFVPETDERVRVEGRRICFEKLRRARHDLVLSANPGLGAWRFRFRLTDRGQRASAAPPTSD
jgi:hypothetical protein